MTKTDKVYKMLKTKVNRRVNKNFTANDVKSAYGEPTWAWNQYSSALSTLRRLRKQGRINYTCITDNKYVLTAI